MSYEEAFLIALGLTVVGTITLTWYLHRPLRPLLAAACMTPERGAFWLACIDIILILTPILGLFISREFAYVRLSTATTRMIVADMLWGPLLGTVVAVCLVAIMVTQSMNDEPSWDGHIVRRKPSTLPRLIEKVESVRARDLVVESKEDESDPRAGSN